MNFHYFEGQPLYGDNPKIEAEIRAYRQAVIEWFAHICDAGYKILSGDDIMDLYDAIRQNIHRRSDADVLTLFEVLDENNKRIVHPLMKEEEIKHLPFLFHLVNPIALKRIYDTSEAFVSDLSMGVLYHYSQGFIPLRNDEHDRFLKVLHKPNADDLSSKSTRETIYTHIAYLVGSMFFDGGLNTPEHERILRSFWSGTNAGIDSRIYPVLSAYTASYNCAYNLYPAREDLVLH